MVILSEKGGEAFASAQGVYVDWRERATSFETVAGAYNTGMILSGVEQARRVSVGAVSHDFFDVLGARPVLGRPISRDEDQPGRASVALLGAEFWRSEFSGNPNVLGRTLVLNGKIFTVTGVIPDGFRFAHFGAIDVWVPMAANRNSRGGGNVVAIGRLARASPGKPPRRKWTRSCNRSAASTWRTRGRMLW